MVMKNERKHHFHSAERNENNFTKKTHKENHNSVSLKFIFKTKMTKKSDD